MLPFVINVLKNVEIEIYKFKINAVNRFRLILGMSLFFFHVKHFLCFYKIGNVLCQHYVLLETIIVILSSFLALFFSSDAQNN